jgi:hypothetical protein
MSVVINLYGGPGTGKSTSAAYLFYLLKSQGKNAELVREYVKDWAWEGRNISTYDQIYLLGKQVRRESMLYGKVDFIVTDAPVMLGIYYASKFSPLSVSEGVRATTLSYYRQAAEDGHQHHHVFLERTKPYKQEGRFQNEEQAKQIDNGVYGMLSDLRIPLVRCGTQREDLDELLTTLKVNNPKA